MKNIIINLNVQILFILGVLFGSACQINAAPATSTYVSGLSVAPGYAAVDAAGNNYFILGHSIQKVLAAGGAPLIIAGNVATSGSAIDNVTGTAARFNSPKGMVFDSAGNIYVADSFNNCIRKITPTAGAVITFTVTTFATGLNKPTGLAIDGAGNLYVADTGTFSVKKVTPAGVVTPYAGTGANGFVNGAGSVAQFGYLNSVAVDATGNVYVLDRNNCIRKITPPTPSAPPAPPAVTTYAGSGPLNSTMVDGIGAAAQFKNPTDMAIDSAGNLYVIDSGTIRKIAPGAVVSTLITFPTSVGISNLASTGAGVLFVSNFSKNIQKVTQ